MVTAIGANKGSLLINLNKANQEKESLLEKLASGKRINKAKDDAAGLSIVSAMEAQGSILTQSIRNNQDAVSALTITEGAAGQITTITNRMQELAMQSSNGVLSDTQREPLAAEFNALRDEVNRIAATTEFNGRKLMQGENFTAQIGLDGSADSRITVSGLDVPALASQLATADIKDAAGAQAALAPLRSFGTQLSSARGEIGAVASRLQVSEENNRSLIVAGEEAASRIRDTDVAETTARLTAANIRSQAAVALQAHQNQPNARILDLLK